MKKSPRGKSKAPVLTPEQQAEYDTMKEAAALLRKTMKNIEKQLDPGANIFTAGDLFVVMHRSQPGAALLAGQWFKVVP